MPQMKNCPKCHFPNEAKNDYCGQCGAKLERSSAAKWGLLGGTTILVAAIWAGAWMISLQREQNAPPAGTQSQPTPSPADQPVPTAAAPTVAPPPATVAPPYTEAEYRMYREVMESREAEDVVIARLARQNNMTPAQVKAAIERVLRGMYQPSSQRQQQVRAAVERIARVKEVTGSGDFAGVSFVVTEAALNDADVRRRVLERVPQVLEAIFSVQGIERTRVIGFYPSTDGSDLRVMSLEANRSEYSPGRRPETYREFWIRR